MHAVYPHGLGFLPKKGEGAPKSKKKGTHVDASMPPVYVAWFLCNEP